MNHSLTQIQTDLTLTRREQSQRIARLRELKQEIRDLQVLVHLGERTINRLKQRKCRAIAAAKS